MLIDWSQLINWTVQAVISFIFGGLGTFVAFRFSIELERRREERENQRSIREQLQGGKIPPANIEQAVKLGRELKINISSNPYFKILIFRGILIVKNGQEEGKAYQLYMQKNYIGTGLSADVKLSGDNISENHAYISCENKISTITDTESVSGTFVNNERISETTALNANDEILIGDVTLIYKNTPW
jgi:hypothetical protein